VQSHLTTSGIATGIHYPIPLHLTRAYESMGLGPGDFPIAESAAAEVLSLPMFPNLTADSQMRVAAEVIRAAAAQDIGALR
jgi:dTDP-4-amino-4,6-dideoxygalactose transaminase